jgi:radical SAM protein with 4Fe4S-binding SPASM domain
MDPRRNEEIKKERLSPAEIVRIEQADLQRFRVLKKSCAKLINPDFRHSDSNLLFFCGGGKGNFTVSYNGIYRPCSSLWREDCVYDLKKGTVREAWQKLVPKVRNMRSDRREFLDNCRKCSIFNLCIWCPAHAYLETGEIDAHVGYFCRVAHARAEAISQKAGISS